MSLVYRLLRSAASLAGLVVLAGCAAPPKPAPPVLLTLGDRQCVQAPDLAGARPLALGDEHGVTVTFDAASPCVIQGPPPGRVYAVFRLPNSPGPYLVTVTSQPDGPSLFPPELAVLDAVGRPLRTVPGDKFAFHDATLFKIIRTHPGDAYLLVLSDGARIGRQNAQITGSAEMHYVVFATYTTGKEDQNSTIYAYSGQLVVTVMPIPKAD